MLQALSVFYGFGLSVGCPLVACVTTLITSVKLYRVIKWRQTTSSSSSSAPSLSVKEVGVTKMLICLSMEFVVLSIPFNLVFFAPIFHPQLYSGGLYANTFRVLISAGEVSTMTSSSVNFFIYYFAGTRFRDTLKSSLDGKHQQAQKKRTDAKVAGCGSHENTKVTEVTDQATSYLKP
jgi:hypothetical protein